MEPECKNEDSDIVNVTSTDPAVTTMLGFDDIKTVAGLERLLCDVIVAHDQREKYLLDQIATLHADIRRRSESFQQTLTHYRRQFVMHGRHDLCDSDSGVGEPAEFGVHLTFILNRNNGSLGFNIATATSMSDVNPNSTPNGSSTTQTATAKDLVVSRVHPEGASQGKLCLHDRILKVNGIDLNSAGLDEAVAIIKGAQEPVVVEVIRQMSSSQLLPGLPIDKTCQTEFTYIGTKDDARCNSQMSEYSDELRKYDIEYEEVTLSKSAVETKLGLTICCSQQSESSSDVFIEQVDPESVAGLDGRIKQGDQIIQVNGVDIHDHNEALGLLDTRDSRVSFVVARPHLKQNNEEPCYYSLEEPEFSFHRNYHPTSILEEDEEDGVDLEDVGCVDVINEKDSGVGVRTDESTKNDESCSERDWSHQTFNRILSDRIGEMKLVDDTSAINIPMKIQEGITTSDGTLDRSEAVELWVESTANNAAKTLRSVVASSDLCCDIIIPQLDDGELSSVACECCVDRRPTSMLIFPPPPPPQTPLLPTALTTTQYTDRNNLERTIHLQQQLLRRSLLASSSSTSSGRSPSSASATNKSISTTSRIDAQASADDVMEWRVKRRTDGSRYVVRRPVRSRMLRERAVQLAEERSGLTTDDDAASEMKAGRYWSKDERKRHLERAREHRKRKEEVIRSRACANNQISTGGILELSRRKMTRVRGRNLFDDFTTVQEVLAHGSNCVSGGKVDSRTTSHRLLSVTTV